MPRETHRGRRPFAAATAVALCLALTGCSPADTGPTSDHSTATSAADDRITKHAGQLLPRSRPVSIEIPRIGARSTLVSVGLNSDGTLAVPPVSQPMQAAWYERSPTPGERGPAVLLGHVDGGGRPGIFHRLRTLTRGDNVLVTRQDGRTAEFLVRRVEQVAKDSFPTSRVYGNTAGAEIRLITCGGSFDSASGNYRDNVIVYGTLRER